TPVSANADWQPFTHIFEVDGVSISMSLVPEGCFMMGTESGGDSDERPVSEVCFDQPFWIDTFEVSNAQFNALNGVAGRASRRAEDERPREQITWFEARDFCVLRGDRLPTEAEWEYAARGPDALIYPWGNDFDADRVIDSSDPYGTADIGPDLRQNGRSWIGAYDLSGNVWEWVSSLYQPYPYSRDDGREADMGNRTDVLYVLRGGSFINATDYLRGAGRNGLNPNNEGNNGGFRCARSYQ
nr:formylglycine-generating enzyme family protein [Anaerolineae bacterium]